MTAKVLRSATCKNGGKTYDVEGGAVVLAVELYPGNAEAGEQAFIADITFVVAERTLSGEGSNRRSAFLAAASRFDTTVRSGVPLPAIAWFDFAQALEDFGAF